MKTKQLIKIKEGEFIQHKHYGLCYVDECLFDSHGNWFGLTIRPLSVDGFNRLANWSGVLINRVLEHSNRLIMYKVENPTIPKLIFEKEGLFEVHEWKILGEVSDKGKFSTVKLKVFKDKFQAISFALLY